MNEVILSGVNKTIKGADILWTDHRRTRSFITYHRHPSRRTSSKS